VGEAAVVVVAGEEEEENKDLEETDLEAGEAAALVVVVEAAEVVAVVEVVEAQTSLLKDIIHLINMPN
jgi:hypothetical protein